MLTIEINMVHLESLERLFTAFPNIFWSAVTSEPALVAEIGTKLGADKIL